MTAGAKKELEERVKHLQEEVDNSINDTERGNLLTSLNECKNKLQDFLDYRTQGLLLRCKAQYYEKGEKNTKYFLNLERRENIEKTMNKLHKSDGTFTTNQKEILEGQATFYSDLYKSKSTINKSDILTYLDNIEITKLSIEEKNFCDGDLTIDECYDTLKTFGANKTPGNDGLSVEFYKQFWCWIGKPMVQCFNTAFTKGELSTSQRQAVIKVLDEGKDRSLIENWRPISLINVDYKIISKTIANRLKVVLPKLIHHNQVGFITGRNIAENLRAISDIFDYTKDFNVPGNFDICRFSQSV